MPSSSLATARFLTVAPGANADGRALAVAVERLHGECAGAVAPTAVTLSSAPVIAEAGMPDSVGIVMVRSPPGVTGPAPERA